jgi:uncharacterized protein YjlB
MTQHLAADPQMVSRRLDADGPFPNNPTLPLVIYRQAIHGQGESLASVMEQVFEANGWGGSWRNGVFGFQHFHSNAHEVLGIASGSASIQFGGPNGPVLDVAAGDVAMLPAGTAPMNAGSGPDFRVIGAYPEGQEDYDMMRGDPAEQAEAAANIAQVPLPTADPVYGVNGPLFQYWQPSA